MIGELLQNLARFGRLSCVVQLHRLLRFLQFRPRRAIRDGASGCLRSPVQEHFASPFSLSTECPRPRARAYRPEPMAPPVPRGAATQSIPRWPSRGSAGSRRGNIDNARFNIGSPRHVLAVVTEPGDAATPQGGLLALPRRVPTHQPRTDESRAHPPLPKLVRRRRLAELRVLSVLSLRTRRVEAMRRQRGPCRSPSTLLSAVRHSPSALPPVIPRLGMLS